MNNKDNVKRFHLKYTSKLIYFDFQRKNIFFSGIYVSLYCSFSNKMDIIIQN